MRYPLNSGAENGTRESAENIRCRAAAAAPSREPARARRPGLSRGGDEEGGDRGPKGTGRGAPGGRAAPGTRPDSRFPARPIRALRGCRRRMGRRRAGGLEGERIETRLECAPARFVAWGVPAGWAATIGVTPWGSLRKLAASEFP